MTVEKLMRELLMRSLADRGEARKREVIIAGPNEDYEVDKVRVGEDLRTGLEAVFICTGAKI